MSPPAVTRSGPGRARALLASALALAVAAGACGSSSAARVPAHHRGATSLTVDYRPHGNYPAPGQSSPTHHWTLACSPPRGTHPAKAAACRELAAHGSDLTHQGVQCLVIVRGGPSATVTGTLDGRPVHFVSSTCSRAWTTLHALLTG